MPSCQLPFSWITCGHHTTKKYTKTRQSTEEMNFKRPTHILAAIAIAVGCWWSFMFLLQPLKRIWTEGFSDALPWFGLFITPMMIIPGAMALYSGIGLLKEVTKEGIKGSVGALSIFGAFWGQCTLISFSSQRTTICYLYFLRWRLLSPFTF